MVRWGLLIIAAGVVGWIATLLAGNPGAVALQWYDYRIDTSAAVLAAVVLMIAAVAAVLYRLWWSIVNAPAIIRRWRGERRQRMGFQAFSHGLVAVAAGDAETAERHARRAEALLDDPPLTLLLTAQVAQLEGDNEAAQRYFTSLSERPATEFLGVRGLLTQAIARQDWQAALPLARRAYRLNAKSPWVVSALLDLQQRLGQWADAQVTLDEAVRLKVVPAAEAPHRRADILYQKSLASSGMEALDWAGRAAKADPDHRPALLRWVRLLIADGRHRKAAGVLEDAWARAPAGELLEPYWEARQCSDAAGKLDAARRLAARNPGHAESRIAIATAALEARQWGEVRTQLEPIAGDDAAPRVCRLMAELEEAEHGDLARARTWLMRAAERSGPTAAVGAAATMAGATAPATA
jgi:HemY protein